MEKSEIEVGLKVVNFKHKCIEEIIGIGKQKQENGEWVDSVIYKGKDRFTGKEMIFSREMNSFLEDFGPYQSKTSEDIVRQIRHVRWKIDDEVASIGETVKRIRDLKVEEQELIRLYEFKKDGTVGPL